MVADPWPIDAAAGAPAYNAGELRLLTTTPFLAGAGASLGVRSGVRPSGSGTDLLVQAQAAPNMTVKANTGVIAAQGAISATQGAYTWALDALLSSLTIAAAHATLARTDLVAVRIRDANVDTSGQRDGGVIVITGTAGGGVPTLPTDATYFELARIAVAAAVTTIVAGNITDRRQFAAALGGFIVCTSTTRPLSPLSGQRIWETDTAATFPSAAEKVWNGSYWDPGTLCNYVSAASLSTVSTTLQNATGLAFPMEASGKYIARYVLLYSAGQVGDMAIGWTVPSGAAAPASGGITLMSNVTTDLGGAVSMRGSSTLSNQYILGGTGSASPWSTAYIDAYFECGANAGNAQMQYAQAASDPGTNTTIYKGSSVVAFRVA